MLIAEIVLMSFGISALVRGRHYISKKAEVTGTPARVLGIILLMPLPLALLGGMIAIGGYVSVNGEVPSEGSLWFLMPHIISCSIVLAVALILGAIYKHPPRPQTGPLGT